MKAGPFSIMWRMIKRIAYFLSGRGKNGDKKMEAKTTSIVIVGMKNSAKFGKCLGADVDATTMTNMLSAYGKPVVLRDAQARKAAVVAALSEAIKADLCIFCYSGHGGSERFADTKFDASEPDGKDEYLCLYDTYLKDTEIWNIISKAKGRVFMVFDCCHSATMFRSATGTEEDVKSEPFTMQMLDGIVLPQGATTNLLVWSGCPDDNYSYGDASGGVLTNAIKKSFDKDRTYDEVWEKAKKLAADQHPQRTQLGEGFGGKVFR